MTVPYCTQNANAAAPGSLVYVWSPQGALGLLKTTVVPAGWPVVNPTRLGYYFDATYCQVIQVPVNAAPGPYTVTFAGPAAGGEVVAPTPPLPPPLTVAVVAAPSMKLSYPIGFLDATAPAAIGNTVIDGGYQATYLCNTAVAGNNPVILPTGPLVVRRMRFVGNAWANLVLHAYPLLTANFAFQDCVFANCCVGSFTTGETLFKNCTFDRAAVPWESGSVVFDGCTFKGCGGYEQDPVLLNACNQALFLNCDWQQTERGIHICPSAGPAGNVLVTSCRMYGVGWAENNAGECFLVEATNPVSGCTVYGTALIGCSGPGIELTAAGANGAISGIQVVNCTLDTKVYSALLNGGLAAITGCRFTNVETSAEIFLKGTCNGNAATNIFMRQQARSSGNQLPYPGADYLTGARLLDESTGGVAGAPNPNVFTNVVQVSPNN